MRYQIHRGGQARTVKGVEARRKIERLAHGAVIETQGDRTVKEVAGAIAWWTDLRRGQLSIYGALLRYIDVAVRTGTEREKLKAIPRWIDAYIDESYEPTNTGELKLVA